MPKSVVQTVVRINPGTDKTTLSKAQKEFNRLTKKIEQLNNDLDQYREVALTLQQRIQTDYAPLLKQYQEQRARLVKLFDRAHESPAFKKTDRKKLAHLIISIAHELISEYGHDDLKSIFDKYHTEGFDTADTQQEQQVSEMMKEMMSVMYGIEFDDTDVSTKDKFTAYINQKMAEMGEQQDARQQQAEERKAARPKTAKQLEREAKKQEEEQRITKSVRALYMDLVKAFHPDREPDEAEKQRKTEIMQRVTEAYEQSDLLALLRLQLEFERIDQTHLETLAEDQLRYYNKILKQQVGELEEQYYDLQAQVAQATGKSLFMAGSADTLLVSFESDLRGLKRDIKAIKKDITTFADETVLKGWLKTYRINPARVRRGNEATVFDLFGDR